MFGVSVVETLPGADMLETARDVIVSAATGRRLDESFIVRLHKVLETKNQGGFRHCGENCKVGRGGSEPVRWSEM